jgi:hypothetical protein
MVAIRPFGGPDDDAGPARHLKHLRLKVAWPFTTDEGFAGLIEFQPLFRVQPESDLDDEASRHTLAVATD